MKKKIRLDPNALLVVSFSTPTTAGEGTVHAHASAGDMTCGCASAPSECVKNTCPSCEYTCLVCSGACEPTTNEHRPRLA